MTPADRIELAEGRALVVAGPTAVGKSAFGLEAARRFGGEIVSADSRQVYSGLDIGTAKATAVERQAVPHHLIDILQPDGVFGLAVFLDRLAVALSGIRGRGKLPVVVGGSSQYVFALMEGWSPPRVPPDPKLRAELERRAETEGPETLHAELAAVDPKTARRIDPRNVRRVIRALEVRNTQNSEREPGTIRQRDEALAEDALTSGAQLSPDTLAIGLTMPREALYRRIDARVDGMMEAGWLPEVERLLKQGYGPTLTSMSSIGYQELSEHLGGGADLADAIQMIKHRTHRLARNQYVWLRRAEWLEWFEADDEGLSEAMGRVGEWQGGMP